MLASNPTSGLSLVEIIDFDVSAKNRVCGAGFSSLVPAGSGTRSMDSKRFLGLLCDPRPRAGDGDLTRVYQLAAGGVAAGAAGAGFAAAAVAASFASWAR